MKVSIFLKGQSPNMLEDVRPLTTIYQTWGASSSAKVSVLFKMADFENYHDSNSKQLFNIYYIIILYIKIVAQKPKCMVSYVYLPTNLNQIYGDFHLPSWHECLGRSRASPFRLAGAIIGKASKTVHTSTVNPCRFFHREFEARQPPRVPPARPGVFLQDLTFFP